PATAPGRLLHEGFEIIHGILQTVMRRVEWKIVEGAERVLEEESLGCAVDHHAFQLSRWSRLQGLHQCFVAIARNAVHDHQLDLAFARINEVLEGIARFAGYRQNVGELPSYQRTEVGRPSNHCSRPISDEADEISRGEACTLLLRHPSGDFQLQQRVLAARRRRMAANGKIYPALEKVLQLHCCAVK